MGRSNDPFESAFEEQEESPPDSPIPPENTEPHTPTALLTANTQEDDDSNAPRRLTSTTLSKRDGKAKDEDEDEEEDYMDGELEKLQSSGDPNKMAKMQEILSQFTVEQMSRYESFRRSGFQKANMKKLLASITGSQKISIPMTIVVSGIAKIFVGELVETARMVMTERNDCGPIRPCHIREAYRRLKLEGKVPKRSIARLLR